MREQHIFVILSVIIVGLCISFTIDIFREKEMGGVIAQELQEQIGEVTPIDGELISTEPPVQLFYKSEDFGLVATGNVIAFSPSLDYIDKKTIEDGQRLDIYIHIQDETGYVAVEPIEYDTWLILKHMPELR